LSSVPLIDSFAVMLSNMEMKTIEETRLERLRILIAEFGSVQVFSDHTKIGYAQISQWLNRSPDSKTGKPRTINSSSARKMESLCKKERGWFDQPVYSDNEKIVNAIDSLSSLPPGEGTKIAELLRYYAKKKRSTTSNVVQISNISISGDSNFD